MSDVDDDEARVLAEYRAARDKVDDAVALIAARRADDLACRTGCASCCVAGLSVLAVEARAIIAHIEEHGLSRRPAPPPHGCAFLDDAGACTVYAARPFVCRTHGLPLRADARTTTRGARALTVLDDVSWCALNFTERPPAEGDVLDATRVQALLTTVDARYRAASGDDDVRVSLADIARAAVSAIFGDDDGSGDDAMGEDARASSTHVNDDEDPPARRAR